MESNLRLEYICGELYPFIKPLPVRDKQKEPMESNICLESICGEIYPFIKPLPVKDKQSESFTSIDYKPPLYVGNMPHDKTSGKNGEKNEKKPWGA